MNSATYVNLVDHPQLWPSPDVRRILLTTFGERESSSHTKGLSIEPSTNPLVSFSGI